MNTPAGPPSPGSLRSSRPEKGAGKGEAIGDAKGDAQAAAKADGASGEPQAASGVDQPRIARAVREILLAVGEDPDRDGLQETPARVARMYAEMFSGLHDDPR